MHCIRPIKAGFTTSGDITFSNKKADKTQVGFEFECRKCLPCRLNLAREKAIRSYHESKMHKNSIFLTLTYNEESLKSPKLQYIDFQLFMKSLREKITRGITDKELKDSLKISYMVTGEYGELNKRPHWHAIIFNYSPEDSKYKYTTDRGEHVYTSQTLSTLWNRGNIEFGTVTLESAGYVARYAAKKLTHGKDHEHDYHPIHKTSSKRALGRSWIEKYYEHTFNHGFVVLPNGQKSKIPRYYTDWLKKNKPDKYVEYISNKRQEIIEKASLDSRKERLNYISECMTYRGDGAPRPLTRSKIEEIILKQKFKKLQERLKL